MSVWKKTKLSDLINIYGGGTPRTSVTEYWNGNIPWLSVKDFNNDSRYVYDTEKKITEAGLNTSSAQLMDKGTIVVSARGTVGELTQLGVPMTFNQSCYGITNKETLLQDYLYYLLIDTVRQMKHRSDGGVFSTITRDTFDFLEVIYPEEKDEQGLISSILSSLDEKIELNLKMNELFEEIGQLLFRNWFLDFEFPWDFKNNRFSWNGKPYKSSGGEMVLSELGEIPKGWKIEDMDATFDFKGGAQPPKSTHIYEYKKGYVRFIQNRDYASINNLTYIKENSRNKLCDEFDILMDKYGEVGKIRCGITGAYNVALAKIEPLVDNFQEYLRGYFSQTYIQKTIESAATASTRGSLNKQVFLARKIIVPDKHVLKIFEYYSKTSLESYFLRNKEIAGITKLRDLLLPRLMSGKLRVQINK